MQRLSRRQVGELPIPLPPLEVQREVALTTLDHRTRKLSGLTNSLEHQIDLLLERRQALIAGAATGQLEVPGVAA